MPGLHAGKAAGCSCCLSHACEELLLSSFFLEPGAQHYLLHSQDLLSRSPAQATVTWETPLCTSSPRRKPEAGAPFAPLGHGQEVRTEVHAGDLRVRELGRQEAAAHARAAAYVERIRHAPRAAPRLEVLRHAGHRLRRHPRFQTISSPSTPSPS